MLGEKILNKKLNKIDELKSKLISRSEETTEEIIEEMKENMEDLELILQDFGYIKDTKGDESNLIYTETNMFRDDMKIGLEELQQYNGQNGKPAYVAVNGIIYDVTNNKYWKDGKHFGAVAGTDMTNTFLECHSQNPNMLKGLKIVGELEA